MENRSILVAFLVAWAVYVPAIYISSKRIRIPFFLVTLSHVVPTTIALAMISIFLIGNGATVRQYVAGSASGMNLWSLWCGLWPLFLLAAFTASVVQAGATLAVAARLETRRYLALTIPGLFMAIFALLAVFANFPDA